MMHVQPTHVGLSLLIAASLALFTHCDDNQGLGPHSFDDHAVTYEDTPVAIDVLRNDRAILQRRLNVIAFTTPEHGELVLDVNDVFTYSPHPDYFGQDAFTYTHRDAEGNQRNAQVTIEILPVNDPPRVSDDEAQTSVNQPVTIDVLSNDHDPEDDPFTIIAISRPNHGTNTFDPQRVTYTPRQNFIGTDLFTYTVADVHGATATATVRVSVIELGVAPVAVTDRANTDEDTPVTIDVMANDLVDSGTLTLVNVTRPANGRTEITTNQRVLYTPNLNYFGTDTFRYTIQATNGWFADGDVIVTVRPIPDPPVAVDDLAVTGQRPVLIFPLKNDYDVDGDLLRIVSLTTPSSGTATIQTDQQSVLYTPAAAFTGTDVFHYTIADTTNLQDTAKITVHFHESCTSTKQSCDDRVDNGCEVDTADNRNHCGACHLTCPQGQSCVASLCTQGCQDGWEDCDLDPANGCETDLNNSDLHCGECARACEPLQYCHQGQCQEGCRDNTANCDDNPNTGCESNLLHSANHCGACANACASDHYCDNGDCVPCPAQRADCDRQGHNQCEVNLQTNPSHCGTCANPCADGEVCVAGTCALGCEANTADCDGNSANGCETLLLTDADHCGACDEACGPASYCSGGNCTSCPTHFADCNRDGTDACEIDLRTDATHCGECNSPCPSPLTCDNGTCHLVCPPNTGNCDNQVATGCESDLLTDKDHCGACGDPCTQYQTCTNGTCLSCPTETADCLGTNACTTDLLNDDQHCGLCGQACVAPQTCVSGTCSGE